MYESATLFRFQSNFIISTRFLNVYSVFCAISDNNFTALSFEKKLIKNLANEKIAS